MDLTKAFDPINYDILLQKVNLYDRNEPTVSRCCRCFCFYFCFAFLFVCLFVFVLFCCFLFTCLSRLLTRTQSVSLNGVISSKRCTKRSVPRGSVLEPLLFCLYMNDFPLALSVKNAICDLSANDTSLQYASFEISDIEYNLNENMNVITDCCGANYMFVHPDKIKSMIICSRQQRQMISRDELNIIIRQ